MNPSILPAVEFVKTQDPSSSTGSTPHQIRRIGQILLDMGKLTLEDIENILQLQKTKQVQFGAAAKQLGLISDYDIQHALVCQLDGSELHTKPEGIAVNLPVINQPDSILAESIRSVRTQLILRGFPSSQNALAIVGIQKSAETSHFVASLAAMYSQLGKRTLLIDANIRNPVQHKLFGLAENRGLSDLLVDHATIADVLVTIDSLPNLALLPSGTSPVNSSELLSLTRFKAIHELLTSQFDVVIYDTPDIQETTDALMVCHHCDFALLLVLKHRSRLADVSAVNKQMTDNGIAIIGSVLIDSL
ncbi:CpsD/CapB family tyrosine-protein kinase [Nitrosomonas marina]|uniref:Chain length determinant protein tyrosine kinase EpsG n=1 Tax=Nitrosomonas marina TaxID=917 RepID=A0A1H8HPK1_9PROT|nr:CpsD/CapB family tyrosine-protein kinase [Nitrosomonas marina]SEN58019.1 chain length determinant protein tyrosine kinase EpsG [Nitrosomonas marina]